MPVVKCYNHWVRTRIIPGKMAPEPILGAGGIVVRSGDRPLFAVVQRRKNDEWVLPKGKLKREEGAVAAAEREVKEETGQDVVVHEFLGAISYRVGRRPKVVQFWRMQACDRPARKPTKDIKAVKWLPLESAIRKLTDPLEQLFLQNIAERSLTIGGSLAERSAPGDAHPPLPAEQPTTLTLPIAERSIAAEPPVAKKSPSSPTPRPVEIDKSVPSQTLSEAAAVTKRGVAPLMSVPIARLNPFGRILRRLWRDVPDLSQLLRWSNGNARRSRR